MSKKDLQRKKKPTLMLMWLSLMNYDNNLEHQPSCHLLKLVKECVQTPLKSGLYGPCSLLFPMILNVNIKMKRDISTTETPTANKRQ